MLKLHYIGLTSRAELIVGIDNWAWREDMWRIELDGEIFAMVNADTIDSMISDALPFPPGVVFLGQQKIDVKPAPALPNWMVDAVFGEKEEVIEFTRVAEGAYPVLVGEWFHTEGTDSWWVDVRLPGTSRSFRGTGNSRFEAERAVKRQLYEYKINFNEILVLDGRADKHDLFLAILWRNIQPTSLPHPLPDELYDRVFNYGKDHK